MKSYRCHKRVEAAKVIGFVAGTDGKDMLQLNDGSIVAMPQGHVPVAPIGGYYVRYEDGYTSWSPADVFESGYSEIKPDACAALSFSVALDRCKTGAKITRAGWNGKGMWVEIQRPDVGSKMTLPYLYLNYQADARNPQGTRVPWLASQTDMLANDWSVLP